MDADIRTALGFLDEAYELIGALDGAEASEARRRLARAGELIRRRFDVDVVDRPEPRYPMSALVNPKRPGESIMPFGMFKGQTFDRIYETERGRQWLGWIMTQQIGPALRLTIKNLFKKKAAAERRERKKARKAASAANSPPAVAGLIRIHDPDPKPDLVPPWEGEAC